MNKIWLNVLTLLGRKDAAQEAEKLEMNEDIASQLEQSLEAKNQLALDLEASKTLAAELENQVNVLTAERDAKVTEITSLSSEIAAVKAENETIQNLLAGRSTPVVKITGNDEKPESVNEKYKTSYDIEKEKQFNN